MQKHKTKKKNMKTVRKKTTHNMPNGNIRTFE